jgi:hypothetical protein
MGSSCDVPLIVSTVRVSRIACMNHASVTIVAVAFGPVKSLPRMTDRDVPRKKLEVMTPLTWCGISSLRSFPYLIPSSLASPTNIVRSDYGPKMPSARP